MIPPAKETRGTRTVQIPQKRDVVKVEISLEPEHVAEIVQEWYARSRSIPKDRLGEPSVDMRDYKADVSFDVFDEPI